MSDPYNQGQGGYGGQNYNQYPPQPDYNQQTQWNQQGAYGQAPYGAQQGYGAPPAPNYAQPYAQQQAGGMGGPPTYGGFSHGQQSQPMPQQGQYNQGQDSFAQNQQYVQQATQQPDYSQGGPWGNGPPPSGDPSNPYGYQRDPVDPNAPQEGERGFLGAVAGGVGGHYFGGKYGHGLIGTLAGAFLGSKAQDKFKQGRYH